MDWDGNSVGILNKHLLLHDSSLSGGGIGGGYGGAGGVVIYFLYEGACSIWDFFSNIDLNSILFAIQNIPQNAAQFIQDLFGGGTNTPPPGDPNWGRGFNSFRELKNSLGLQVKVMNGIT